MRADPGEFRAVAPHRHDERPQAPATRGPGLPGHDEPAVPGHLDDWPEIVGHPDQRERARRLVRLLSAALPVVDPFERVVREGARADEEVAGLARDLLEWRHGMATRIVDVLAGADGLRPGISREQAADRVLALGGPEVYHLLVGIRGWSPALFDAHLADLLGRLIPDPLA